MIITHEWPILTCMPVLLTSHLIDQLSDSFTSITVHLLISCVQGSLMSFMYSPVGWPVREFVSQVRLVRCLDVPTQCATHHMCQRTLAGHDSQHGKKLLMLESSAKSGSCTMTHPERSDASILGHCDSQCEHERLQAAKVSTADRSRSLQSCIFSVEAPAFLESWDL